MTNRMQSNLSNPHTVPETLTVTMGNGTEVIGTVWLHPSRRGSFEVEYEGRRVGNGRAGYAGVDEMREAARTMLRGMAEKRASA
jgi:hypothetical protein